MSTTSSTNKKPSLIDEYFALAKKYKKSHGNGTILLMQVGSFYEIYGLDEDKPEMLEVANLLSICITRRDGKSGRNAEVTRKNPWMSGFPEVALVKMVKRLIEAGYIAVVYNQTGEIGEDKKHVRQLLGIYSPGTFVSESAVVDSTNMVGVWVEELEQLSGRSLPVMGFASIDLGTGRVMIHEVHSSASEPNAAFDELVALSQKITPREVVLKTTSRDSTKSAIGCFELDPHLIHIRGETPRDWERSSYQNEVLERVFGKRSPSAIEDLELERRPYALRALVMVLEWAWEHVNSGVKGLLDPESVDPKRLVLGNAAIFQLNVLENAMLEGNYLRRSVRSLFDVVNNTTTVIGRRFLKRQLTVPLISKTAIDARLSAVAQLIKDRDLRSSIGGVLTGIMDLEKLHRRMVTMSISPQEFYAVHSSYTAALEVADDIRKVRGFNSEWVSQLKRIHDHYSKYIRIDRLQAWGITDIRQNLFVAGVDDQLDRWEEQLEDSICFMQDSVAAFQRLGGVKHVITLSDRDGYIIKTTKKRADDLAAEIKRSGGVKIGKFRLMKLDVRKVGTGWRIGFELFDKHSDLRRRIEAKIATRMRKRWSRAMQRFYNARERDMLAVVEGISELDFLVSGAKTAIENKYCRPQIETHDVSSMDCVDLRHPIIEQLLEDTTYTPHTIRLCGNGMLLYGSNASGKSSLSKAVGLACIMAQCGMYVPASSMRIVPYRFLYARITGNDNILRGQSSFAVEMLELRAILRRASAKTLVLGDEVCRGTEVTSGTAIVASTVVRLAETSTSFIFATHLHALSNISEVTSLRNVSFFHIHSTYDEKSNRIIYERSLRPGQGDRVYGLQVATSMLGDRTFSDTAGRFVKRLMNETEIVEKRRSKWNSNVYLTRCEMCQSKYNLNVHHIRHRAECRDGYSEHVQQDHRGNLVVVCRPCHDMVHAGVIRVDGWLDSSSGRVLKWERVNNSRDTEAIVRLMGSYSRSDYDKRWAHQHAVQRLAEQGVRTTAETVAQVWAGGVCKERKQAPRALGE